MRGHLWPFTRVLGRIWRFVTRKVRGFFQTPRLADVTDWGAQAASLPLSAASRNASRDAQSSNIEIGSRQAAANYRPAACAPRKITSALTRRRFFQSADRRAGDPTSDSSG